MYTDLFRQGPLNRLKRSLKVNQPGGRPSYAAYHVPLWQWDFPSSFGLTLLAPKPAAKPSLFRSRCLAAFPTLRWSQRLPEDGSFADSSGATHQRLSKSQPQGILRI